MNSFLQLYVTFYDEIYIMVLLYYANLSTKKHQLRISIKQECSVTPRWNSINLGTVATMPSYITQPGVGGGTRVRERGGA